MKKIFYVLTFLLLIFSFNANMQISPVLAQDNIVQEEVQPLTEDGAIDNSTEDVLDKPIFDETTTPAKTSKFKVKLSSLIVKGLCAICILLVISFCLFFIVIANRQRRNEQKRKRMSANANVINAVDNFARHRINK